MSKREDETPTGSRSISFGHSYEVSNSTTDRNYNTQNASTTYNNSTNIHPTSTTSSQDSTLKKVTNVTVNLNNKDETSSLFPSIESFHHKVNPNQTQYPTKRRTSTDDEYNTYGIHINDLQNLSKAYTTTTNNIDDIDSNSSSDDIESSVIHRILDNESFSDSIHHDKMHFNKLYNKYNTRPDNTVDTNITDFEQYNALLNREEKLRQKLDHVAKRKGKSIGGFRKGNNILTTLNEKDMQYLFANAQHPKEWVETKPLPNQSKSKKTILKNVWNKTTTQNNKKSSYYNENGRTVRYPSINEKKESPYGDFVSSFSSIPIDDDIQLEDLPIDLQPFRKIEHYPKNTNSDNFPLDIDIVVSGGEKVDYDFHRINEYQTIDPAEPSGSNSHGKFRKLINKLNLLRMIRIQKANKYQIQRKLNVRHLHQIALGGTLGVGLLLSSGKAFSIAGPLGCLLGFAIAGCIVITTMLSFCEIVTLIPLCGGVSGIASRFVDDAFGFALGVVYWVTYTISFPSEITASAIMLSFYKNVKVPGPHTAGWITLFFCFTLLINLLDIRVYGEFEYYSTIAKLLILVGLMIYMIVLNRGGSPPYHEIIGFRYWNSGLSNITEGITFGPFRPTFDVDDNGLGSLQGIGGNKGRFLQVIIAAVVASYAYVGTEIVIIAGSESRNPRQAIPSATKTIFYRIIVFYLVAIFLIGLNIYSGDPRLLRYFTTEHNKQTSTEDQDKIIEAIGGNHCGSKMLDWGVFTNGNQSPWVIAIQSAGACSFASAVNAFLLYFALTAASSQLYASSRTLYFMSIQNKAPSIFSLCTKRGVPYMSVLFTSLFGLLSYLSVQDNTALIFERLVSVCSTAGLLVWSGMCLSFIRFYYALRLRPDIISRNDGDYPYRSPLQPYLAYFGLILGLFLVFASGFVVFLKNEWSALFFISSYGTSFLFVFCYLGYKLFKRCKLQRLDQIDLDSGRREIDRVIWEDEQNYASNFKEILIKGINLLI